MKTFEINGKEYPDYLRRGNGMENILPIAKKWCFGKGVDVGAGRSVFPGAIPVDPARHDSRFDALHLPEGLWDYIFSSHCLEHLGDPEKAIDYWISRLRPGGVLFLYLPHPDNEDWHPVNNRSHFHILVPVCVADIVRAKCRKTWVSERDMFWSFCVIGEK